MIKYKESQLQEFFELRVGDDDKLRQCDFAPWLANHLLL